MCAMTRILMYYLVLELRRRAVFTVRWGIRCWTENFGRQEGSTSNKKLSSVPCPVNHSRLGDGECECDFLYIKEKPQPTERRGKVLICSPMTLDSINAVLLRSPVIDDSNAIADFYSLFYLI